MPPYKSSILTPSPLRHKSFVPVDSDTSFDGELGLETPVDADDIFSQSPFRPSAPLMSFDAHLRNASGLSRRGRGPIPVEDDDDDGLFLSSTSSSTPAPSKVTIRHRAQRPRHSQRPTLPPPPSLIPTSSSRLRTPTRSLQPRPSSSVEPSRLTSSMQQYLPPVTHHTRDHTPTLTPTQTPFRQPAKTPLTRPTTLKVNTNGIKRKPAELPVTEPYPKGTVTPLSVTKSPGEGSFGRLAPLPAPKFRVPQSTDDDTEVFLRGSPGTMGKLCIGEGSSPWKAPMTDLLGEEEAVDVSPGGHIVKRRAKTRPMSWELRESANNAIQKSRKTHDPQPSTIAFPSTRPRTASSSSSATSPRPRSNNMSTSSHRSRTQNTSQSRTRTQSVTHTRPMSRRVESSGSATLFFGPAIPQTATPARATRQSTLMDSPPSSGLRPQPQYGRPQTTNRHSYAGPIFGTGGSWASPCHGSSSPTMPGATDDEEIGEITDEDEDIPMNVKDLRDVDEEDIFFGSSSFNSSIWSDEGVSLDPDDSFSWGSAHQSASLFSINVTESTPSPRAKKNGDAIAKLEKKFKPRDSGISLTDDEDSIPTLEAPNIRVGERGFGIGRSGSVSIVPPVPSASTSVSSIASSDQELVTPSLGPSSSSGWPGIVTSSSSDAALSLLSTMQVESQVDAFILRTLLHAQDADAVPKRPPGTPQKRSKAGFGARPWQSAVAAKVGFDFGKEKKKPRQSLPAAFPLRPKKSKKGKEGSDDEEDMSPSDRNERYDGLGLGRPSAARPGKTGWLMRRSSSGTISTASGTSGETSWPATPTGNKDGGWQLPPPRIPSHLSPMRGSISSHLSPARTASSSSSSTTASSFVSPTGPRHQQVSQLPPHLQHRRGQSAQVTASGPQLTPFRVPQLPSKGGEQSVRPRPSLGSLAIASMTAEEQPGKFEREFVEVSEVGSGEFGKVMKVRRKTGGDEAWAVKKSKRFEGVRNRLRLREEVDILRHLSQAQASATGGGESRHPNVLTYVDSWEQDEALFIQTELCELGNFAHFLWEYGRAFPQLEEARVWKIIAELSNGLRFIHDAGVIHLDLKPANIFVTSEGAFKIGDFGMASLWPRANSVGAGAGSNVNGEVRPSGFEREGDKVYLAPEVLQGRYGKAADVFSLGITILETASNIVVPDQGEPWHRLRQDDFSQVDFGDASVELTDLIRGMMRSDPVVRVDVGSVWAHPVVARARAAMNRMRAHAVQPFVSSPLASVPEDFLDEILGHMAFENDDAMDIEA